MVLHNRTHTPGLTRPAHSSLSSRSPRTPGRFQRRTRENNFSDRAGGAALLSPGRVDDTVTSGLTLSGDIGRSTCEHIHEALGEGRPLIFAGAFACSTTHKQ